MSTGADCVFYEKPRGQWWYKLQRWPYGETPAYDRRGPFATSEKAARRIAKLRQRAAKPPEVFLAAELPATELALVAARDRINVAAPPTKTTWGQPGSQAEAYKRIIMSGVDDDLEVHTLVAKELGAGKAGPKAYAHWYRNWLVKHGHKPPRDR